MAIADLPSAGSERVRNIAGSNDRKPASLDTHSEYIYRVSEFRQVVFPLVMRSRKLLLNFLKLALTLVILYFLGKQVYKHWTAIRDYHWDIQYAYLALSVVCAEAALLIFALAWRRIIGSFGYSVTPAEAFKISYLSNLGRYVPGKIWQLFGILYLANKKDIPAEPAGASFVIFQLFTIPAAFLVFVLAAQVEPAILVDKVALLGDVSGYLMTGFMLLVCALLVYCPGLFLKAANVLMRRLSRPEIAFRLDKTVALRIFLCYCLGWIVYGLAFWLLLLAVARGASPGLIAAIGIYAVAYQIGYLFLFAPGGFGPRELVMAALLAPFAGPIASAVVIVARLWSIVIEAIAALVALRVRM